MLYIRKEYIAIFSIRGRRSFVMHNNPQPIIHIWPWHASIRDLNKRPKKSHTKNHVCFSASVPNSLSQNYEISVMLKSGQELSEKDSQNVYPTKSKSKSVSLHTTEHSHPLSIDLIIFSSLYIPLPLILHFSSPVEEALRNTGMYMYI